jgi:hypothetical protein
MAKGQETDPFVVHVRNNAGRRLLIPQSARR